MCSVSGSPVGVGDEEALFTKDYKCQDCGHAFKGYGVMRACPSCKSKNVKRA